MPDGAKDRPTTAHEYLFLLSASERYYYDAAAIEERAASSSAEFFNGSPSYAAEDRNDAGRVRVRRDPTRNKRSVWPIAAQPYAGTHCAVMPPALVEPCILAGCPPGGVVLDPFAGACTTGLVALRNGRRFVGIELGPGAASEGRLRMERDPKIYVEQRQARLFPPPTSSAPMLFEI